MPTDKFCGGVCDDMRTPFERTTEIGRCECIVNHQWNMKLLRDFRHFLKRKNIHQRIADRLSIEKFCIRLYGAAEILRIRWVNQCHTDSKAWERVSKLTDCPAIKCRGRNDMITRFADRQNSGG